MLESVKSRLRTRYGGLHVSIDFVIEFKSYHRQRNGLLVVFVVGRFVLVFERHDRVAHQQPTRRVEGTM